MITINPKWYRVYNDTCEYFTLAKSRLSAWTTVCDHVDGGAFKTIEYATMSGVCSNIANIVGDYEPLDIHTEEYYYKDSPKVWWFIDYTRFGGTKYSIPVLEENPNEALDWFDDVINITGDAILDGIRPASKKEVFKHLEERDMLSEIDDEFGMNCLDNNDCYIV